MTTTPAPRFRFIGITDENVDCQREGCFQVGLNHTVVLVPLDADGNDDGEPVYYGSTCAAYALRIPGRRAGARVRALADAANVKTRTNAIEARRMLAHYGLPETGEPNADDLRAAARIYIRTNYDVAGLVQRSGRTTTELVLETMRLDQRAIADARVLKIPGY